uniref:uncharacterized protein n=1 Tax=Myxine glutinosa TaxID=7769 RepID=UPI00358E52FF
MQPESCCFHPNIVSQVIPTAWKPSSSEIFLAAKTGDVALCKSIVEQHGPSLLLSRDADGHTPAHWAALAGYVPLLRYFSSTEALCGNVIVDRTAVVNTASFTSPGAYPIHWAAVGGHVAACKALLDAGVPGTVADSLGCTPLVVAAQNGHTALACYLLHLFGADAQACDEAGDDALHWAAFKGHCELVKLLIYFGFNPHQVDIFGQTPLHLAALSGNLLTVQLLCEQDPVDLHVLDKQGNSPLDLARGRRYNGILLHLSRAQKCSSRYSIKLDLRFLVCGPPGRSRIPVLFFIGSLLLWLYPLYMIEVVPRTLHDMFLLHLFFVTSNAFMWWCFVCTALSDPGYLLCDTPEYHQAIKQCMYLGELGVTGTQLARLCHTCQLVRPLRSKHCRVANRCVGHFDHYCPYVYNTIGRRNKLHFCCYLLSMAVNCSLGMYFTRHNLQMYGWDFLFGTSFIFLAIIAFFSSSMSVVNLFLAAINSTMNEWINRKRYAHLKNENGYYRNLFYRGVKLNLLEFLKLIPPQTAEELEAQIECPLVTV